MNDNSNTISSLSRGFSSSPLFYMRPFNMGLAILNRVDQKILLLPLDRFGIVRWVEKHDWAFTATQLFVVGILSVPFVNNVALALFDKMGAELSLETHRTIASLADKSVTELKFNAVRLYDTGFTRILAAINEYSNLQNLELTFGVVGDEHTTELAKFLEHNKSLIKFDLSSNPGITSTGAEKLAEGLKLNTTLNILTIRSCQITDAGTQALEDAAVIRDQNRKDFPLLLDLRWNRIPNF